VYVLPVPFTLLLAAAEFADFIGINLPINRENLLGVRYDSVYDTKQISEKYQLLSASETIKILDEKS
jgi:hypothetical protein